MTFPTLTHGWVLGDAAACTGGQVRTSVASGATWTALACPVGLTSVLSVAFSTEKDGLLLGRAGDATRVLRTSDGGRTWVPVG